MQKTILIDRMLLLVAFACFACLAVLMESSVPLMYSNGCAFLLAFSTGYRFRDPFHPLTIIPAVHGLYALLPLISVGRAGEDSILYEFGTTGGAVVFSAATAGMLLYALFDAAIGRQTYNQRTSVDISLPPSLAWLCLALGTILNLLFFAAVGFSQFLSASYEEGFEERLAPGMGIFVYGITLTMIALVLFWSCKKVQWSGISASILSFLLLFLAHGQRKYFILPLLICAVGYHCRIRKLRGSYVILASISLYFLFVAVGSVRQITNGGELLISPSAGDIFTFIVSHLGQSETAGIYGTASAAFEHFIEPMPMFGDYLLSWKYSLPQIIFPLDFLPANVRFAIAYNFNEYLHGVGWGFSLFGEAYLVLGIMGPPLAAITFCHFSMKLYRLAKRDRFVGLNGALWFSFVYFMMWAQRNAFAYFIREWVVSVAMPIGLMAFLAASKPKRFFRRPKQLGPSTGPIEAKQLRRAIDAP